LSSDIFNQRPDETFSWIDETILKQRASYHR
jgi:hypothetical protein